MTAPEPGELTAERSPARRERFAERLATLIVDAGEPTLESLAREAQNRLAGSTRSGGRGSNQRGGKITKQRISDWKTGKRLPGDWEPMMAVLGVLIPAAKERQPKPTIAGLYQAPIWKMWWKDASADQTADERVEVEVGGVEPVCPYRGLAVFDTEHAKYFHGRTKPTNALRGMLANAVASGGMVALVGASGAGKSSLLRAGLLPALQRDSLPELGSEQLSIVLHTPGENPCAELSRRIPELAELLDVTRTSPSEDAHAHLEPDTGTECAEDFAVRVQDAIRAHATSAGGQTAQLLLIVDQAEELFTLCDDDEQRALYIDVLAAAGTRCTPDEPAAALVLFAVRADFYQRCLSFPTLADALQHRQLVLGPMTTTELREAINSPAQAVGLRLESGLFELLLRDMGVRTAHSGSRANTYDPGVLPLLSHALQATWRHRLATKLTTGGYRAAKGIQGAVAATAERAWDELDPAGQTAAMQTLVKLTRLGADSQDTRRRWDKRLLIEQARDGAAAERALETLASARLVTLDAQTVEITHEALLHAWPRLRHQLDKDRAGILIRQELEEDATTWGRERDNALLYRGSRLANARVWAASEAHRAELSPNAVAFLDAAIAQRRRGRRVRHGVIAGLTVLTLLASATAVWAIRSRDGAIFTQVVAEADRFRGIDPSLSAQLDLVAHRMRPDDVEVEGRILSTQNTPLATVLPGPGNAAIDYTGFSPDGRTLATAGKVVQLWALTPGGAPTALGPALAAGRSYVSTAAFSPNGGLLASTGGDGILRIWDVTDRRNPVQRAEVPEGHGASSLLAFSPDGGAIATAGADGTVTIWDITEPSRPAPAGPPLTGHTGIVRSVVFSADGHLLASGGDDSTILLHEVTDRAHPRRVGPVLRGHSEAVRSVAFSPDRHLLASSSDDKTLRLWNLTTPEQATAAGNPFGEHKGSIWSVAFSPDGRTLASGSQDGTTKLWNVTEPSSPDQLGAALFSRTGGIYAVGFSPDGQHLATGGDDGTTQLWTLPPTVLAGPSSRVFSVAFSPDGHTLAASSHDHSIWLWNVATPGRPTLLGPPLRAHNGIVTKISFSPDGRTLASASGDDRTTRLWDLTNPAHPVPIGAPMPKHTQYQAVLGFSPDGRTLVTSDTDTSVRLWDITERSRPVPIGAPIAGGEDFVQNIAVSPDPARHILAIASYDGVITLRDITDPGRAKLLGAPLKPGTGKIRNLAFSPDGRTLAATGEDKTIRAWDVSDPTSPVPTRSLVGHHGAPHTLAFSPDGTTLASAGADKTARVWKLTDSETVSIPLTGHTGTVRAIAFSPNGQALVTGSDDNTVQIWDLSLADSIRRVCATTQGTLTSDQWSELMEQLSYNPPTCV